MRVRLLGPVAAGPGSEALAEPPGQVPAAVLAHLALARGNVLTADALADLVWDAQPENVRNALQAAVSRLRRSFGEDIVETSHGGYRLGPAEVDAIVAAQLLARSRAGEVEAGARALALWEGQPLAGLTSSASDVARRSLEELRLELVLAHADALARRGRARDAVPLLQEATQSAPYDEALEARLMRALAASGRAGDALTEYDRFRRRLADDLGIDPSSEVASTFAAILDGVEDDTPVSSVSEPYDVTVLLTDVVGSARMWREQPDAVPDALLAHHSLVSEVVGRCGGALPPDQGEGDARMAVFLDPDDALTCAAQLQRELAGLDWPHGLRLHVRAAIARGSVVESEGNVYGAAVPMCARLRSLAHGDQVLVAADVVATLREGGAFSLRPLGRVPLRDFGDIDVLQLDDPALQRDFPPLRTTVRLPARTTPVVGRETDAAELVEAVLAHRLVTLTGLGGCGKTTLATEVAGRVAERFPDGVHFVDLSSCTTGDDALGSIGTALLGQGSSEAVDALRGLGPRTLLVLDNLEQLDDAARLMTEVLAQSPAHLLCTSRAPVGAAGELVHPLGGLGARDAVDLLTQRATEQGVVVAPLELARLAHSVGGLPLALELAAGRLRLLDAAELADEIDQRLAVLSTTRGVPERQRAVEALLDDTWGSLDDEHRRALTALSLVRAPITAAGLADLLDVSTVAVADALDELVTRGLVRVDRALGGQPTVSVLELVRRQALGAAPPEELADLRRARVQQLAGETARDRTRVLLASRDDVVAALRVATEQPSAYDVVTRTSLATAALALDRWDDVVGLLDGSAGDEDPRIDNLLGVALVRSSDVYAVARGRLLLERAASHGDADAAASLGGSLRDDDPEASYAWYRRALELDPRDAYALGNVVEHELLTRTAPSPVDARRDVLGAALARRRAQADAGEDLPWSAYDAARLGAWLGADDALARLLDGVATSTSARQVETTLASFRRLPRPDETWQVATLVLDVARQRMTTRPTDATDVLVLAGASSDERHEAVMAWAPSLAAALAGSAPEIVSGGTDRGVSALAADVAQRGAWLSVGWLPDVLPDGVEPDTRYSELRRTGGAAFSLREPVAYWQDLLHRGVDPARVHVLGLGGGPLTVLELRLAQALGARVAVGAVDGSVADVRPAPPVLPDDPAALRAWWRA